MERGTVEELAKDQLGQDSTVCEKKLFISSVNIAGEINQNCGKFSRFQYEIAKQMNKGKCMDCTEKNPKKCRLDDGIKFSNGKTYGAVGK